MIRYPRGFTLIELLVTVAIFGALAAVVLPVYSGYAFHTRTSELSPAASACRHLVTEAYQMGGASPGPGAHGCEALSSRYVGDLAADANGVVPIIVRSISANVNATKSPLTPSIPGAPASASAITSLGIND